MSYKRISPQPITEGGTGVQSNTAYAVLCGGTTSTGAVQSIASVGSAGEVLTSNGAGALPTFQAAGGGSGPAFLAYVNTTVNDVTGDLTLYQFSYDTEAYDTGGDFSTTTFTAPTTGKYHFEVGTLMLSLGVAFTSEILSLNTSNRNYFLFYGNCGAVQTGTIFSIGGSAYGDMDVGDTASVSIQIGGSTKTVDVLGAASSGNNPGNFFSGMLVL